MIRAFISGDMASVALGADEVAQALVQAGVEVIRTGSRGLFRTEPLVEIETDDGRIGYGPVEPQDVAAILDGSHPNRLGDMAAIPFLASQQRFTFQRVGITDPLSLADYAANDGWAGLTKVICPPLSGPETMIVWTTKGTTNAEQEAQAGRDHREAA